MARRYQGAFVAGAGVYRTGAPAPRNYRAWHSWADLQHKAGLRQYRCGRCGLYWFPQELDADATALAGESVCRSCAGKALGQEEGA